MDRFALFTTPVIVYQPDGLDTVNRQLAEILIREAGERPGLVRSNVGGWHSIPDLSQRPEPCFRALMQSIVQHVRRTFDEVAGATGAQVPAGQFRYAVQGWAMVMGDGDYTVVHDHSESHWSTAYYVDAGDCDASAYPQSGLLSFIDPRRVHSSVGGTDLFPSTFSVRPRTGMLVVFPGWLQHYVHPYRGSRPRICISCNIDMHAVPPG